MLDAARKRRNGRKTGTTITCVLSGALTIARGLYKMATSRDWRPCGGAIYGHHGELKLLAIVRERLAKQAS